MITVTKEAFQAAVDIAGQEPTCDELKEVFDTSYFRGKALDFLLVAERVGKPEMVYLAGLAHGFVLAGGLDND